MMKKKSIITFSLCLLFFLTHGMQKQASDNTSPNSQKSAEQNISSLLDLCAQKVAKLANWKEEKLPSEVLPKIAAAQLLSAPKPSLIKTISTSDLVKISDPVFAKDSIFYKSPSIGNVLQDHIYCYTNAPCCCIGACQDFQGLIKNIIVNPSDHKEVVYALSRNTRANKTGSVVFFHCKGEKNTKIFAVSQNDVLELCSINNLVWAAAQDGTIYYIENKKLIGSISPEKDIPIDICASQDNKPIISYLNGSIKKIIDGETVQEIEKLDGRITGCAINPKKTALLLALDSSLKEYDLNTKTPRNIGYAPEAIHFKQCLYINNRIGVTVDIMGDILLWDLKYNCAYPIEIKRLVNNRPNASKVAYKDGQLAYDNKLISIKKLEQFIMLSLPARAKILEEQEKKKVEKAPSGSSE